MHGGHGGGAGGGITGAPAPSSVTVDSRYYGGHMFTPGDTVHSE